MPVELKPLTKMEMSDFEMEEYRKLDRTGRLKYVQKKREKREGRILAAALGASVGWLALLLDLKFLYPVFLLVPWPIIPILSPRTDYSTLIQARKRSYNLSTNYCFTHGVEKLYNSSEEEYQCVYCQ